MDIKPGISVVVCTYNRVEMLMDTLQSLISEGTNPANYEILVVDNNSTDETKKQAAAFINAHPEFNIRYIFEPAQGLSHARNRGIREARASVTAFFDDDIIAGKLLIQHWVDFFDTHPEAAGGGGKIKVQFDSPRPDWMPEILLTLFGKHNFGNKPRLYPAGKYPFGGNMAYRKELLLQAGLFNTELGRSGVSLGGGEEKELFFRIKKLNPKIYYCPEASLRHRVGAPRLTQEYVFGQALGIGQSIAVMLADASLAGKIKKWISEAIKLAASLTLFAGYLLTGRYRKGKTVLAFRMRVWQGYFEHKKQLRD